MVLLQESWTVVDQIAGKLIVFLTKKWMLGQLTPVKKLSSLASGDITKKVIKLET